MPADANGVPFNAACIDVGGNLLANMRANVAAESIGRSLAARLREMTDDAGMKDMLSFLIARDTMHQQQWLAAIEEAGDSFNNAPHDVKDEGDYKQYAYSFFGHAEEPMSPDARWLRGPSLDGRGEFSFADPAPRLGQEPELMGGPASVHGGIEATRPDTDGDERGIAKKVTETAGAPDARYRIARATARTRGHRVSSSCCPSVPRASVDAVFRHYKPLLPTDLADRTGKMGTGHVAGALAGGNVRLFALLSPDRAAIEPLSAAQGEDRQNAPPEGGVGYRRERRVPGHDRRGEPEVSTDLDGPVGQRPGPG
jgi:hypothetical protein